MHLFYWIGLKMNEWSIHTKYQFRKFVEKTQNMAIFGNVYRKFRMDNLGYNYIFWKYRKFTFQQHMIMYDIKFDHPDDLHGPPL